MPPSDPVLLVEDSEDDVFFFQRAWQQAGAANPLVVVRDGQQAIEYLAAGNVLPGIVLLDLKLPFRSGHEVLRWIRNSPECRHLVVVFLTSSRERSDVRQAYEAGANGYLVKPATTAQLSEMVKAFKNYWLEFNVA